MTVYQLRQRLEEMCEMGYEDCEIRFVYQDNYPLQDDIRGLWVGEDDDDDDGDEDEEDEEGSSEQVVYIVSGGQCWDNPYGPRRAFAEVC